ncbi:uncharacterized protein LOC141781935 [Sebastes fasciatus]|uniref:uncharacterized protein LOC141781935 n=1 Tax=Sebastes fasciatus TaxID=394691 RepID=UPI003D9E181C
MDLTGNPGVVDKQSISSPENRTIHAYDGRVVTRISIGTQSERGHEAGCSQDYKDPNEEASKAPHKNFGLTDEQPGVSRSSKDPEDGLQRQTQNESVPKNMESELEISPDNEALDLFVKEAPQTPESPAACQGETEASLTNLDEILYSSGSESSEEPSEELLQTRLNFLCEYCKKKKKKPPVSSVQITNSFDPEEHFCCVEAYELSRGFLEAAEVITEETMTDGDPEMQEDQRLDDFEFESSDPQTPKAGHKHRVSLCLHDRLSDAWTATKDDSFPEIEIIDSENAFSFSGTNAGQKRTTPFIRRYNNGQTFIVIFPDGTGQVWYPSGQLAILLAAQPADWWCVVVLEDKHLQPRVQAVFTNRGQSTCYHNNGCIWVNLAPWGGTYCSDTGDLKKDWDWLDNTRHVHAPPIQPLYLTLSPNINVRFQSQEHICITFISGDHIVRLNVGANLKPDQGKGLTLPGPDTLQRYLQQKSAEINALLQNIQSLIGYQKTVSRRKVKPR